jgi:hypothetical protein
LYVNDADDDNDAVLQLPLFPNLLDQQKENKNPASSSSLSSFSNSYDTALRGTALRSTGDGADSTDGHAHIVLLSFSLSEKRDKQIAVSRVSVRQFPAACLFPLVQKTPDLIQVFTFEAIVRRTASRIAVYRNENPEQCLITRLESWAKRTFWTDGVEVEAA